MALCAVSTSTITPSSVCTTCCDATTHTTLVTLTRLRRAISAGSWMRYFSANAGRITSSAWNASAAAQYTATGIASDMYLSERHGSARGASV